MRTGTWLAATLLIGCSSTTSMPAGPDAAVEEDESDARPRADARPRIDARPIGDQPDASLTDAAPGGSADARLFDARLFDARVIDAAPMTPDAQVLALRPWSGSKARFRVLDVRMAGPSVGVKVCIFDEDSDPRPYSVLVARSLSAGSQTVAATYTEVPATSGLRVSFHTFVLGSGQQPDTSPAGCNQSQAEDLRGGTGLTASAYYTAVYDETDAFDAQCETSFIDGCEFYPRFDGSSASQCAEDGLRIFRDAVGGTGGFRVMNMTADASLVTHTPSLGLHIPVAHVDVFIFAEAYEETIPGTQTFICPKYVECMGADLGGVDPLDECTSSNGEWIVGEINNARIEDETKFTSFYLVGDVRDLASDASSLVGPSVTVITAHDGAN